MDDTKQQVLKAFAKEYGYTSEGVAKKVHGYTYLKHINLYVYHMRKPLLKLRPDDALTRPEGHDEVEDIVKMFADHVNWNAVKLETNDYHAKVMRLEDSRKLFRLDKDLDLPDLPKTIVPYEVARKTIIKNPESICVIECPCRAIRGEHGCQPRDVCLILGEPWASFVLEFGEDVNPRRITQAEALEIVESQNKAGNVQALFWKGSENDRVYAMCNCCACCCVALTAQNYAKTHTFASSGYKCMLDADKCVSCGACVPRCKFGAFLLEDGQLRYDPEKCLGCGVCQPTCPADALSISADDPEKSLPLDLAELAPECMRDA